MSMTMKKIGRKMMNKSFSDLYEAQKTNQQKMLNKGIYDVKLVSELPIDNVQLASYHALQLMSEVETISKKIEVVNERIESKQ